MEDRSSVTKLQAIGKLIQELDFLIWDESVMSGKATINVVDKLFRDITNNQDEPFGGKLVIFGGDFRQTLCVAKRQGRAGIIHNTIIKLPWWKDVKHLHLTDNMRVINQGNTLDIEKVKILKKILFKEISVSAFKEKRILLNGVIQI